MVLKKLQEKILTLTSVIVYLLSKNTVKTLPLRDSDRDLTSSSLMPMNENLWNHLIDSKAKKV
jgi:hypothetical protein